MLSWKQDLVFALRQMRRSPGATAAAVLTLALGIGATTTIYSVLYAVVLDPLPFPEPDRLLRFNEVTPEGGSFSTSEPNFLDFHARSSSFEALGAARFPEAERTLLADGEPRSLVGLDVTAEIFLAAGIAPLDGRTFLPEETEPGAPGRVVVLSHAAWQRHFGGEEGVVGSEIVLDGEPWSVVGVMPRGFDFPGDVELWTPLVPNPDGERGDHRLECWARLAPGVSLRAAREEVAAIAARLAESYPVTNEGWSARVDTVRQRMLAGNVARVSWLLALAVVLLLLLASTNVSNMLLAQASSRQREIGLRAALGAGRARIMRQLLSESVLFSFAGAALGVLLAAWAVPLIRDLAVGALPRIENMELNGPVLVFTVLVSVATGLLFGLAPALRISSPDVYEVLREGHHLSHRSRLRGVLVVAEMALAMMLVLGAGLLVRSFLRISTEDVGFDTGDVLVARINLPQNRYAEMSPETVDYFRDVVAAVETAPGVYAAGAGLANPLSGRSASIKVGHEDARDRDDFVRTQWRAVTPGYFRTLGLPVLAGRSFQASDRLDPAELEQLADGETPEFVAIVSESLARRVWGDTAAVGRRLQWAVPGNMKVRVVGVVGDVVDVTLGHEQRPTLYFCHQQVAFPTMSLVVRTAGGVEGAAAAVRERIRDVDRTLPVPAIVPLTETFSAQVSRPRFQMTAMAVFAAVALLLAATGIYGVVSFAVAQRRREIGIRMALGARPREMLAMVVRDGLVPVAAGIAVGTAGALAFSRALGSVLYETSPTHGATYVGVALLLGAVALLAALLPARRASAVDPRVTLANE